ncbi:class I SAM-dependent methyltransferase [Tenuifilum osseticum]|uniref:class I SAM-dependent methyltransferase n=1 Tax=Tenuifilum osseticum TaxID=3374723 RepID=UPI0034E3D061
MLRIKSLSQFNGNIEVNDSWNFPESKELLMHKIHTYPAKFPAFLTPKIVSYLKDNGAQIKSIGDIFCGCGTSALESRLLGIDYLGYDINPVATMIAKAKSNLYLTEKIIELFEDIIKEYNNGKFLTPNKFLFHERIRYWFDEDNIIKLYRLQKSIYNVCPDGKYRILFLTAFSNILKSCSKWLTKSIKPQIDPNKIPSDPYVAFKKQISFIIAANEEIKNISPRNSRIEIKTQNILNIKPRENKVDLIITSPPYVTSYEYADLHQLSTLWLGFVNDYKELRKGTIGSEYARTEQESFHIKNKTGQSIVKELFKVDKGKSKSVAKYFYDLDKSVDKTYSLLNDNGHIAFVIGNTCYKGVYIDNAKVLIESLINKGFKNIEVTKRKISSKILTPYRNQDGKFSSNKNGKKVYSHEFIIMAKKPSR